MSRLRGRGRGLLTGFGAIALAAVLASCGGHGSTSSAQSKPTLVAGEASPAGALSPSTLGFAGLAKLARAPRDQPLPIQGVSNQLSPQAISTVSTHLNQFWSQEFARSGIRWEMILQVLVQSAPVKTRCSTTVAPTHEMFLCIGDAAGDTFYWTLPWMQQNVGTGAGGMNLALGMAALYSDVPLDLFGFRDRYTSGAETSSEWEEQKFCLTGVYAASLTDQKLIQQAGAQTIDNFLSASGGSAGATRQQLEHAFAAGLRSGKPGTCASPGAASGKA